jgi:hypothetical protein
MKKSKFALILALTVAMSGAWAKLPAPSEEAQAKAAEAKVKAAENAKMESELLGKTQDRVAQKYIGSEGQGCHRQTDADCATSATGGRTHPHQWLARRHLRLLSQ